VNVQGRADFHVRHGLGVRQFIEVAQNLPENCQRIVVTDYACVAGRIGFFYLSKPSFLAQSQPLAPSIQPNRAAWVKWFSVANGWLAGLENEDGTGRHIEAQISGGLDQGIVMKLPRSKRVTLDVKRRRFTTA
jgi:hypothetical protein